MADIPDERRQRLERDARAIADRLGIPYESIAHDTDASTSTAAQAALGDAAGDVVKLLVLLGRDGATVAALLLGSARLDVRALSATTGVKNLRFARPDVVESLTGFPTGGVPPFLLEACDVRVISRAVLDHTYVVGAAGHPWRGARLRPIDLLRIPGVRVDDIG